MGARSRVVSVRLTGLEFGLWSAAAGRSPFGTTAGWCRDAVVEAVAAYAVGSRPWTRVRVPDVPAGVVESVRQVCAALNSAAMRSNRLGALVPEARAVLADVVEAARSVPRIEAAEAPGFTSTTRREIDRDAPRPHLVNVRVSAAEFDEWTAHASADGYARVSGWVRAVAGALLGLVVPPEPVEVPGEFVELRRQLGGAITNLAQLRSVAESSSDVTGEWIVTAHAAVQTVLAGLYGPRKAQRA